MAGYVWDLSGTEQCASYGPGHQIHWIHFNHSMCSMWEPSVVIPVTAVVDDDGLVHIEGDGLSLVRWNHRPALVRAALQRFGGMADWKPRWRFLAVPTEAFMGGARSVFHFAAPGERTAAIASAQPTLTISFPARRLRYECAGPADSGPVCGREAEGSRSSESMVNSYGV